MPSVVAYDCQAELIVKELSLVQDDIISNDWIREGVHLGVVWHRALDQDRLQVQRNRLKVDAAGSSVKFEERWLVMVHLHPFRI